MNQKTRSKNSKKSGEKQAIQKTSKISSRTDQALEVALDNLEKMAEGRNVFIQALSASKNPAAAGLMKALGRVENDGKSIYEVALSIRSDPLELQKAFSEGLQVHNALEAFNKLFKALPGVMKTTIDSSKSLGKEGFADRKMLLQLAGLFPKEGGLQISLNQNFADMVSVQGGAPVTQGSHDLLHQNPYEIVVEAEEVEEVENAQ